MEALLAAAAVALLLAVLALSAYSFHKIRAIHILALENDDVGRLFRQLEALQNLRLELGLQKSLPPTRGWAASPDILLEVAQHALREKPRNVVECSSGVSTIVLARCMQINGAGKVTSLEHDPVYAAKTVAQLRHHGLGDWAEVIVAPLRPHALKGEDWPWYAVEGLAPSPIDLLVVDGPPGDVRPLARYPAGPVLFARLAEHSAVFLDDADRDDERAVVAAWQAEFPGLTVRRLHCEKGCAVLEKGVGAGEKAGLP